MGPLMLMVHDGLITCKNGATYFRKLLVPQNVKFQINFDQLKSMNM